MAFATLFSGVAARLFDAPAARAGEAAEAELLKTAVEEVVDAVDPRLRTLSGYFGKIAPGVARTIAHLRALAGDLPAPVALSRAAWADDALLNALFATSPDVPAALGRSEELRAFFLAPQNCAAT